MSEQDRLSKEIFTYQNKLLAEFIHHLKNKLSIVLMAGEDMQEAFTEGAGVSQKLTRELALLVKNAQAGVSASNSYGLLCRTWNPQRPVYLTLSKLVEAALSVNEKNLHGCELKIDVSGEEKIKNNPKLVVHLLNRIFTRVCEVESNGPQSMLTVKSISTTQNRIEVCITVNANAELVDLVDKDMLIQFFCQWLNDEMTFEFSCKQENDLIVFSIQLESEKVQTTEG